MPVTYLDVPEGLHIDKKRELVKRVYDALHHAYPFPDDVRIFLREWPLGSVSQDGLLGAEPARPVLTMHVPQGVDVGAKRTMLQRINSAMVDAYHLPKFMVFINEYPLDLVALDGVIHSDNSERVENQRKVYGV
jgi:phenylpyruvate tautomerase PptA (4-oxalocrotonate tautomerase family)